MSNTTSTGLGTSNYSRARFIAIELNDLTPHTWEASVDQYDNISIIAKNGLELWLRFGGYGNEGKIRIGYCRPRDNAGQPVSVWSKVAGGGQISDPSIKVSESKNADVIAKDIVRRLLKEAEVVHGLVKERIAADDAYRAKKANLANRLAEVSGAPVIKSSHDGYPTIDLYAGLKDETGNLRLGYGNITISSDSADFKLSSVPPDLACSIAAVVRCAIKAYHRNLSN